MKKQPSEDAHQRARTLLRDMTEAETAFWQMLESVNRRGDFALRCRSNSSSRF
jgi:very-short-patch-repair endonuclease